MNIPSKAIFPFPTYGKIISVSSDDQLALIESRSRRETLKVFFAELPEGLVPSIGDEIEFYFTYRYDPPGDSEDPNKRFRIIDAKVINLIKT